jgi:hypothetical protein
MTLEQDPVNGPASEPLAPGWFRGPDGFYPPSRHPDADYRAQYATQPEPPPSPPAQAVISSPPAAPTHAPAAAAPPPAAPADAQGQPSALSAGPPPTLYTDYTDHTGYNTVYEVRWKGGWPGLFTGESQEKALVRALATLNIGGWRVAAAVTDRWSFFKRLGKALLAIVTLGFVVHHPNTILVVERIS